MNPTLDAFFRSWPASPWFVVGLLLSAAVYLRGWRVLRTHDARRWNGWRPAAFCGGLFALFLALASPIETFADLLLQVHMLQHLLLMLVAPPLIWLGAPLLPMLRGLPRAMRSGVAVPVLRSPLARDIFSALTHPLVAWPLFVAATWLWHAPRAYDLALRDPTWHVVEHATFLGTAMLFWYPVIVPYPAKPRYSRWIILPYLILADVQNTVLAAWFSFASEPIYAHYTEVPRVGGWNALADQQVAGVLMWVPGSLALLLPVSIIGLQLLYGRRPASPVKAPNKSQSLPALPIVELGPACRTAAPRQESAWDLLHAPVIGSFLRRRWARPALQFGMLLLAAVVIFDGLTGPNVGAANLAGVAPWIHWRGLVMFGLLAVGNIFCMACPFTLPRRAASRWLPQGRAWPRVLRSKWLAVVLVALFLWSYEAFSLWDSPWLTAWIAIAYFAAAFLVDGLFRGAAFCKYVCPIGQFNFVQSLVSPLEVRVRNPAVCHACSSHDCIGGNQTSPGCGTHLFQPHKVGNLDCTFCLDCVHACPHENIGMLASSPGRGLTDVGQFRSGLGTLSRRWDVAALLLLLVFGGFANAGGMIAPIVSWQDAWSERLGLSTRTVVTLYYVLALLIAPTLVVGLVGALSASWGRAFASMGENVRRYTFALVPLGFGMWLAHHGFHFLTSYATIIPVTQRMAADLGLAALGAPAWQHACCLAVPDWIVKFELLSLDIGMLFSLVVAYQIGAANGATARPVRAMLPWALLILLLFAAGVWIVLEPMQMRGTLPGG